jgi:1-acyl-sn-glycerol-3-phosphate acyltransferase
MRQALRSIWMWISVPTLILLWLPLLALIRLFDRDPVHYRTGYWFRRLGATMTRTNSSWIPRHYGISIKNPRHPYVVVANHLSNSDIPIVSTLPWDMKWVAKAEMFKWPIVGWMLRMAGDIPVIRTDRRSGAEAMIKAKWYLEHKCSVMFFPEGTRSRDGRLLSFHDGAFRLAIKAQVPILPIALDGTQNCLPKNSWKFGDVSEIRLKLFEPIDTTGLKPQDVSTLKEQVRDIILNQVADWRGVPPQEVDSTRDVS